ncbi:MAG: amidohydrolase [Firmicutes bacterium]|nr:amidohydrolase [Bacillota bacterium]
MIAIVNGKVIPVVGEPIESGTVLIENGKIRAVGSGVIVPDGAEIVDVRGKWVLPGLIDAHSHLSLYGEPSVRSNLDLNESTSPNTAQLRAVDALNPDDPAFGDVLAAGITAVYTGPGSANIIGGIGQLFKTFGRTPEEMAIPGTEGMKFALGENPKRVYGEGKNQYPATRMGNAAALREALVAAENYLSKIVKADDDGKQGEKSNYPERDLKLEALARVLKREIKARIHCHRKDDILTGIRISEEFNLDYVIEHCTEGYKIADLLGAKQVMATVGPLLMSREKMEISQVSLKNPGILSKAGVKVALQVDAASETKWLPLHAGIAVREGMEEVEAFKAITINAAIIVGAAERIGSLEPGKDADIAIFSGHPFCTFTVCERTYVNGKLVYQREDTTVPKKYCQE